MFRVSLGLLLFLLPAQSWALVGDSEQPISVEADSLEVREAENVSIYKGNVILVQGSLKIQSDRLVIHFNEARELALMEMTGSPARFRRLDDDRNEIRGNARQIDYTQSNTLLELRGDAQFSQAGDIIEGELIRINIQTNNIEAGGGKPDERVKMLIQGGQEQAEQ